MKGLADLSKLVSADEGRELLTHEIECRFRGSMKNGKRSYRRDLILSDVTKAINKVKPKQLEDATQTIAKSQSKGMLESTPIQTSDETSDQTQQDRVTKKQRLGSPSPIGKVVKEAFSLMGGDHDPNTPTLSMQETTPFDNELAGEVC